MLSQATRLARLKRAEQASGVCVCGEPLMLVCAKEADAYSRGEWKPEPCPAGCDPANRLVVEITWLGDYGCSCAACRALWPLEPTGQGVQRPDRALPSGNERYLASRRDSNGASASVTGPTRGIAAPSSQAPQTPQDAQEAPDVPAYPLDPPRRSQPAYGPPLSLPGRARDRIVEVQASHDLAPISLGRLDPSMLPPCAACSHLASWHSEFRLGGTGCMVAAEIGGGDGPCACIAYNGPPPPRLPTRVHPALLPGCTCAGYFGPCICGAASDFQQSNRRSPQ